MVVAQSMGTALEEVGDRKRSAKQQSFFSREVSRRSLIEAGGESDKLKKNSGGGLRQQRKCKRRAIVDEEEDGDQEGDSGIDSEVEAVGTGDFIGM